jgi:hypothetical protein
MPKLVESGRRSLADHLSKAMGEPRRRVGRPDRRRRDLRDQLWPGSSAWIWDINDKKVVGFATVPRLMPWILHLIKILTNGEKSGDPSPAYLELWCRDFGQGIITIADEMECAYASGYRSTSAMRTWHGHMLKLAELKFILAKGEGLREFGQVLLLNPLAVCARLRNENKVPDEWWTSFTRRASDIGAPIPPALDMTLTQPSVAVGDID